MRQKVQDHLGGLMLANIEQAEAIERGQAALENAYRLMAECIRSDQMSHAEVVARLESDPGFAAWYQQQK